MGLRDRLANFLSKGQYSKLKADNVMLSSRPALARFERQAEFTSINVWHNAYYLEENVAVFSECIQALRRETFRNGIRWKPRFVKKCLECDNEMQEKVDVCDHCGSDQLRDPNASEMKLFGRIDGSDFLQKANKNDQTLIEILFNHDFHLNVADLGYILILKKYVLDDDGAIKEAIPVEILTLDPRDIEFVHTPDGLPGGNEKLCLQHRNEPQSKEKKVCPKCGSVLYDVHYKTGKMAQLAQYYIEGEVLKVSKYYPSLVYGYPPIIKMADDAWAYHYIEKRVKSYYERGRPPGLLTIPTNNIEGQKALWKEIELELREDPYKTPWLAFDPEAKQTIQYLNLMADPNPDLLEVKKELRERFGSRFGVSMVFQADTSASGGLNNESQQITVTNRAVQWGQSIYNDKVLPWICRQFGIKDWVLELPPSEASDEMAEIQRKTAEAQWAQIMFQMGFDVEYEDEKFKISGMAKKQEQPSPFGLQPSEMGGSSQQEVDGESTQNEEAAYQDFLSSIKKSIVMKGTCPPGQHSHRDYEDGKCHPSEQEHRGAKKPQEPTSEKPSSKIDERSQKLIERYRGEDGRVNGYMDREDFMHLYRAGLLSKGPDGKWYFANDVSPSKEVENPRVPTSPTETKPRKELSEEFRDKRRERISRHNFRRETLQKITWANLKVEEAWLNGDKEGLRPVLSWAYQELGNKELGVMFKEITAFPIPYGRIDGNLWFQYLKNREYDTLIAEMEEYSKTPPKELGRLWNAEAIAEKPEGSPEDLEKSLEFLSHEEYCDALFDKSFIFNNVSWILRAVMTAPLMGRFEKLAPQEAENLYGEIVKVMIRPERWSLTDVSNLLKKKFPDLADYEAERIARSETQLIANTARELEMRTKHPDDNYIWIGPNDARTTDICKTIKERQPPEGLPIDSLKNLINTVVFEKTGQMPRSWVNPHIQCRHTFRRVMTYG